MVPHCSFDLPFLIINDDEQLFMCLLALYVFLREMSIWVFCPFFNWVFWVFLLLLLSCISYLYILKIKPLLVASFANIFKQSVGCPFILFMVSFAV